MQTFFPHIPIPLHKVQVKKKNQEKGYQRKNQIQNSGAGTILNQGVREMNNFQRRYRIKITGDIRISGDLIVKKYPRQTAQRRGRFANEPYEIETIEGYIDGHNIDFLKNRVAFDLEWNSKDQTFDRDLLAMRTYFDCGLIDVGVIVTRAEALNDIFKGEKDDSGQPLIKKYGASTTWMGKLRYRLDSRRNGGCPILAVGIGKECVEEYGRFNKYYTKFNEIYEREEI